MVSKKLIDFIINENLKPKNKMCPSICNKFSIKITKSGSYKLVYKDNETKVFAILEVNKKSLLKLFNILNN